MNTAQILTTIIKRMARDNTNRSGSPKPQKNSTISHKQTVSHSQTPKQRTPDWTALFNILLWVNNLNLFLKNIVTLYKLICLSLTSLFHLEWFIKDLPIWTPCWFVPTYHLLQSLTSLKRYLMATTGVDIVHNVTSQKKTNTFKHSRSGKTFSIKGKITYNTNNVIYLLKCPCGLAYVGKTSRALKIRISEHRSNIRNKETKSPMAIHFTEARHNVSALKYCGIEHVKPTSRGGDINSAILKREAFWIYTWDTLSPKGQWRVPSASIFVIFCIATPVSVSFCI